MCTGCTKIFSSEVVACCPVFVISPCNFLLLGGIFVCLLRKCFEKQSGTNGLKSMSVAVGGRVWVTVGLGVNLCSVLTSLVLSVQFTSSFAFLVFHLLACLRFHGA